MKNKLRKLLVISSIASLYDFSAVYAQTISYPDRDTTSLAIGPNALANQSSKNLANIGIGLSALQFTTIGVGGEGTNTAVGYGAATGSPSVPYTGAGATAIGGYALHNIQGSPVHDTGVGTYSLYHTTTGENLTAVGEGAGENVTTGSNITILGYAVASSILTTGTDDIFIGVNSNVDASSANESHSIHIGGGYGDWVHVTGISTPSTESTTMNGGLDLTGPLAASSINFGGTPLSNYAEGTWKPVDSSGANLTFKVRSATYQRIGHTVYVTLYMSWPTTTDTNTILIGGLPYPVSVFATASTLASVNQFPITRFNAGASSFNVLTINGGNPITNANLSNGYIIFSGAYQTS